jgi:hypothetical protein
MESQQCYFSYVPTASIKNILKEEEEKTTPLMFFSQIIIDVWLSVSYVAYPEIAAVCMAKISVLVCTLQDRKKCHLQ